MRGGKLGEGAGGAGAVSAMLLQKESTWDLGCFGGGT